MDVRAEHASGHVAYCGRVYVSESGAVTPVDDDAGAIVVRRHPILVQHALAFLRSGLPEVQYAWQATDGTWIRVVAERNESDGGPAGADVEVVQGPLPFGLSARELDILTLAAAGLSNPEISVRLGISRRTVAKHVETVLRRVDQQGRAGAAAVAAEQGLLRLPVPGGGRSLEGLAVGVVDQFLRDTPGASARYAARLQRRARHRARPILVGSVLPGTPAIRADGDEHHRGAALAAQQVNKRGGVGGRPIDVMPLYVDPFDAIEVRRGFDELFAFGVDAVIVPYLHTADEACRFASEYGAPYLHATTLDRTIELVRSDFSGFERVFHVCPSELPYGGGFMRTLDGCMASGTWRPPNRNIGFVHTTLPGGLSVSGSIDAAQRGGWEIDFVAEVSAPETDWSDVLEQVRQRAPAVVLIAHDFPADLAAFLRGFAQDPAPTLLYALYTPSNPDFLQAAGSDADGLLWSTVSGVYEDPLGARFRAAFQQHYRDAPGLSQAGIGYDQVGLLVQAWSVVGNSRDFRAVGDALRANPYRGINGGYWLGTHGQHGLAYPDDVPDPSLGQAQLVYQVQGGVHRPVSPWPYGRAAFELPSWIA